MTQDMTGEFVEVVQPTAVKGTSISIEMTGDDKLSNFTPNVEFLNGAVSLGKCKVRIEPGSIRSAMDAVHVVAVAAAEAAGLVAGDADYPEALSAEVAFAAAKTKIDQCIASADIKTNEQMAEQIVTLLAAAGPGLPYPQKWGRKMLKDAYASSVRS